MVRPLPLSDLPRPAARLGVLRAIARSAVLTLALSLPQGLLALPIAVAQVGLTRGLLCILAVGGLNALTAAWAARAIVDSFAQHGAVPSLARLAHERLGAQAGLLALGGGAALFFLALIASVVGLARSLEALAGAPALLWGVGIALLLIALLARGVTLGSRLLSGLGIAGAALLVAVLLLALPQARIAQAQAEATGSPLVMLGVSLMLFFAPTLAAPVARAVLSHGADPQAFVRGSAAGVIVGALLFGAWGVVVCAVAGPAALAGAKGTTIPALVAVVPGARVPGALLELLLLSLTALRCALVLGALAGEQLPAAIRGPRRRLITQLPAGLGLVIALALLAVGASSFTQLVALTGGGAASVTSLIIPALLARRRFAARRAGPDEGAGGGRAAP